LRGANDVRTFGGRHVDDVELAARRFAPLHHALDRFGLDEVGTRHRVQPRAILLHHFRRMVSRDQLIEDARRLGVHEEHRAELAHLLERAVERAIVGLPPFGFVDHELLEGGEAALHHPLDLLLLLGVLRDANVEGVVDERFAFGLLHPDVGGVVERAAGGRNGKVDYGRHAAARGCSGSRQIVVGADGSAEGQLEMHMHIEHAGNHMVSLGVDDLRSFASRSSPNATIFSPRMPMSPSKAPAG